jgi:outer membrane protein W
MIHRIYRIVFLLFVVAGSVKLWAQLPANEIGVAISTSQFEDPTLRDPEGDVSLEFDENVGWGVSYNRYWTDMFSTELSYQTLSGDMSASTVGFPTIDVGELDARALTAIAQLHFRRATRFSPYIGVGAAQMTGEIDPAPIPEETPDAVDLESELTWVANVGVDFALGKHVALAADAKFISWEAMAEDDPEEEELDISPVILSVGVKFRF